MSKTVVQRNSVRVVGSGDRTLMFAHGYGCDQNMWRHVTPAFTRDYKIILFNYVGSGLADASAFDRTRYSTLKGYALDVLEILSELIGPVNFIGHSVSSMIGFWRRSRNRKIRVPAMLGPSPCYINDGNYIGGFERSDIEGLLEVLESNHVAWSATMAPLVMGNPESPELTAELEDSFCRMDPGSRTSLRASHFLSDNRRDLPHVRTRSLILQCQQDRIAGLSVGKNVHQCLPESKFVLWMRQDIVLTCRV